MIPKKDLLYTLFGTLPKRGLWPLKVGHRATAEGN